MCVTRERERLNQLYHKSARSASWSEMPNTKITTTTGDEVKIDMDEENTDTEEIEGGVQQKNQ